MFVLFQSVNSFFLFRKRLGFLFASHTVTSSPELPKHTVASDEVKKCMDREEKGNRRYQGLEAG
jgi:hypothetical protein